MSTTVVASRIERVVVYRTGALVTRAAELVRGEGGWPGQVAIAGLPLAADDASLRVSVEPVNGAGGLPVAADVRVGLDVGPPAPDLRPPEPAELLAARKEEARLRAKIDVRKGERQRLSRLVVAARAQAEEGKPPKDLPLEARLAVIELKEARARALAAEIADLDRELTEASWRRADLEEKERLASTARQAREHELRKSAIVTLDASAAESAARARLVLSYMIPGARWTPAYTLRLDRTMKEGALSARALVRQRSGEDWSDVKLTLSTAAEQSWTELPELHSIRIGREQPRRRSTWRPPPTGVEALYADHDAAFGKPSEPSRASAPSPKTPPSTTPGPRLVVYVRQVGQPPQRLPMAGKEATIGAFPGNEVVVTGAGIGSQHARVFLKGDKVVIKDLGGPAGTMVNGKRITKPTVVPRGTLVGIGDAALSFETSGTEHDRGEAAPEMDFDGDIAEEGATPLDALMLESAPPQPFAPTPPPVMYAMPASAAPEAPRAKAGFGLLSGIAGAIAGAAAPSPPPPPRSMPMPAPGGPPQAAKMRAGGGGAMPPPSVLAAQPAAPPELEADEQAMRFGDLRMAPATSTRRGKLMPADRSALYLELIAEQRVSITFDVIQTIHAAVRLAEGAADAPLPPRHRFPRSEAGFDYAFQVEGRFDVPSDGRFHSVPLAAKTAPARPRYVSVPRETQDVFREVVVENPFEAPLLEGPIDVYVDGGYLLTADLEVTPPSGKVTLGLGVEQAIKVSRNTRFEESAAGLLRGSLDLEHEITVELVNHLPAAATVEVRERVPVAVENDADVKVTVGEVDPPWKKWEPEGEPLEGGHRWEVKLSAGEKKQLKAAYAIRIPSGHELIAGNRREG